MNKNFNIDTFIHDFEKSCIKTQIKIFNTNQQEKAACMSKSYYTIPPGGKPARRKEVSPMAHHFAR